MSRDTADSLLRVEQLSTHIETDAAPVHAVDDVSFDIRRGETFALLGESGCGKSMTALSLMRLLPHTVGRIVAGKVWFGGDELLAYSERSMCRVRGRRMAMIFQEPMTSLNPVMTVGAQIAEVLRWHRLGTPGRMYSRRGPALRSRVVELLDAVGLPDAQHHIKDYPHQLSGGMKQRVMIAMALAGEPELLIADEPTTALDVTIQAQVLTLLKTIQQRSGMAMLLITHDLGVVAEVADRVAVMYAGHIIEQAPVGMFFATPRHPYSKKLFDALPCADRRQRQLAVIPGNVPRLDKPFTGCRFAPRCAQAWSLCVEQEPVWSEWSDTAQTQAPGQQERQRVRCHLADPVRAATRPGGGALMPPTPSQGGGGGTPQEGIAPAASATLLEVTNLTVHFPVRKGLFRRVVAQVRAVDGVDIVLARGRTLALVGESGCGKTTAGKGIIQLIRPTAGTVSFNGTELTRLRGEALRRHRSDFQIIFQDPFASLNPRMRIADIIEEGMVAQGIGKDAKTRRARILALLAQVGLPEEALLRYPHAFSGGQRQRVAIARSLAVNPQLIVCDEPTSALDVSVQAQILNLLKSLQAQHGLSYLFITHNIAVVEYLAHEVAVMYLGRIVERGKVDEVLGAPRHPYTQALLSAVPRVDRAERRAVIRLEGELPSPLHPPAGCHFHPRCPYVMPECRVNYPPIVHFGVTHEARCYYAMKTSGHRAQGGER